MKPVGATQNWQAIEPFLPERSRLRMIMLGAAAFLGSLCESLVLVLITLTADTLIKKTDQITLFDQSLSRVSAVLLALAFVITRVVLAIVAASVASRFAARVMSNAQSALMQAYLRSSHPARSVRPPGDLNAVVLTHGMFTGNLALTFTTMAASICGLLAFGGTSLVVNPLATLGIAIIGGLLLVALRPLRKRSQVAAQRFTQFHRFLGHQVTQIESLHREIEVFRVGDRVLDQLGESIDEEGARYGRVRFIGSIVPQIFQASLLGAAVLSLLFIVNSTADADLAAIGAVVLLLIRSMGAAQQLVLASQQMVENGTYTKGLSELIATFTEDTARHGTERPASLAPVRLDGVGFTYDGATTVLDGLDLEFSEGELIGIVGPSGAGKSTLVELLLRLRTPTSGAIRAGGVDLSDVDPAVFAERVAFVPQQPVLINGTIAENVSFFRDLPEHRIREAIRQAHLEAEIDALPDGINTMLGPEQRALSGGQRQRLTIARALAGDPEILVLDEPTSALDAISELAIRETLEELPTGRVVLVVAHRYSTLRSCTRIVVLRDGHVEVDAPPDEVAEISSFFRSMVNEGA